jgi:hypothetical protein
MEHVNRAFASATKGIQALAAVQVREEGRGRREGGSIGMEGGERRGRG